MSSFVWLGLAAVLVVAAVLTHSAPKGGKPVDRTRLMRSARWVLIAGIVVCAGFGLLGRFLP